MGGCGHDVLEIDHGWIHSIYTEDPDGNPVEFAVLTQPFTEADAAEAVIDTDVIYTDVWTSMGQEDERAERERLFGPYQVNNALVRQAKSTAVVMHCLPAYRNLEITDDVIDGPQSIVFQQAENRLHSQRALLEVLLGQPH